MTSLNKQDQHRITFIPIFAYCTLQCALSRGKWQRRVWKGRAARKARGIDKILSKNCWERRLTSGRPSLALFSLSFRSLLSLSLSFSFSLPFFALLFIRYKYHARACFSLPSFSPSLLSPHFHLLTMNRASSSLSLCVSLFLSYSEHTRAVLLFRRVSNRSRAIFSFSSLSSLNLSLVLYLCSLFSRLSPIRSLLFLARLSISLVGLSACFFVLFFFFFLSFRGRCFLLRAK